MDRVSPEANQRGWFGRVSQRQSTIRGGWGGCHCGAQGVQPSALRCRQSSRAFSRLSRWRRLSNGAVWSLSHSPLVTSSSCCERLQITGLKWSTWRPSLSQASAGLEGIRCPCPCWALGTHTPQPISDAQPRWRAMSSDQPWQRYNRWSPWAIRPWCSWQVSRGMHCAPAWCRNQWQVMQTLRPGCPTHLSPEIHVTASSGV